MRDWTYGYLYPRNKSKKFLGEIQRHSQRETGNHSNKDIDINRSYLIYDLINNKSINYRKKVMEVIDSQKVCARAVRKDAVFMIIS